MIERYLKNDVTICKQDGTNAEGVKAGIFPNGILIRVEDNEDMPSIEPGDIIEHRQTNGVVEQYKVIDPCYVDIPGSLIGKQYHCKVKKLSVLEQQRPNVSNTYNITAAQVNVASGKATINATQANEAIVMQVKTLIDEVRATAPDNLSDEDKETLNDGLETIEEQISQPLPQKKSLRMAIAGIKTIAGTAKFAAAVTKLVEFVQSTPCA